MKRLVYYPFVFLIVMCPILVLAGQKNNNSGFRKAKNHIYVIAHRGAHKGIPENSLAAYQKAIDLGCDFIEVDIRTTSDGKFVSVHNADINKYTEGKTGLVKDMELAQLKALDIGAKIGGEWEGTQIPTFEEILKLCQGKIGIYLDLKDAPVPGLMKLIKKYHMERDVVWYIPASHLLQTGNKGKAFGKSFTMPDPGAEENLNIVLSKLEPVVVATYMGVLTGSFVETAHGHNVKVFVDEKQGTEAEWGEILSWGTDGIQTDDPEKLIAFLKGRFK